MDFFEHQDQARRKTKWLALYFFLSVALIILAVYLAFAAVFLRPQGDPFAEFSWLWQPQLFLYVSAGTLLVIFSASAYKVAQLSQGGGVLARTLGGRLVDHSTTDASERRLVNVVEEMAIAAGMPVPEIYVLDQEQGINAFAAGNSTTDAAVGVTRGTLEHLNRDELQGVIAHEFSHILNGDMRINLRLIGILHGLLAIALIGRIVLQPMRFGRVSTGQARKGESGGHFAILMLGIALLIIGSVGVFFGRLIKSAVSRQREYLADAAAVQFTRNPGGIAGALKKIGGMLYGSRLSTPKAEEASHLFFGNGLGISWASRMSTHPPLKERIKRIDPSFDGKFIKVKLGEVQQAGKEPAPRAARQRGGFPPVIGRFDGGAMGVAGAVPPLILAADALSQAGTLTPEHLEFAEALRAAIPEVLAQAAHESFGATALVYCMLLSQNPETRENQVAEISAHANPGVFREVENLKPFISQLEVTARLPLVDMALPALRVVSAEQYERFSANTRRLIESDRQVDLFEYTLGKILTRHLDPHFRKVKHPIVQYYSLRGLLEECAVLLSALAHIGHEETASREHAFYAGADQLHGSELRLLPFSACNLREIDRALDKLNEAVPAIKKQVLNACAHTVASDGVIQPKEAEMLRAIAESLDCPLPPFLPQRRPAAVSSQISAK